jgi:hypothetical protein
MTNIIPYSLVLTSPWGWIFNTETCRRVYVYGQLVILLCAYAGINKWSLLQVFGLLPVSLNMEKWMS